MAASQYRLKAPNSLCRDIRVFASLQDLLLCDLPEELRFRDNERPDQFAQPSVGNAHDRHVMDPFVGVNGVLDIDRMLTAVANSDNRRWGMQMEA